VVIFSPTEAGFAKRLWNCISLVFCAIALLLANPMGAFGDSLRTVALSGQTQLGIEPGVRIFAFVETPALNDAGQTAFNAILISPDGVIGRDIGMWSEGTGALALVARTVKPAPGTEPGTTFIGFDKPWLNAAGVSTFSGGLTGPGVTSNNDGAIWIGKADSLSVFVREGDPAPGVGAGVTFSGVGGPVLNDHGRVLFSASVSGPGITDDNDGGIWSDRSGALELVARHGSAAPGTGTGVNFLGFSTVAFNEREQTAFFALLTGPNVTARNDGGIWSEGSGRLTLIARDGDPAPAAGPAINFGGEFFSFPDFNNAGQMTFVSSLTGAGVTPENDFAVWSEGKGGLALIAREGSSAPGTGAGVNFGDFFSSPIINGAGQVAFGATLSGAGVAPENRMGIWSEADGSLAIVARAGDPAPGTEPGVTFSEFDLSSPALNAAGQIAFTGRLTGPGITMTNDAGIWAQDLTGALTLIARKGDVIEVQPGDFRTILSAFFLGGSGLEDGRRAGFNELGQLAFIANFTDSSSGIFVSDRVVVPEPSTIVLVTFFLISVAVRRVQFFNRT
jgi:hypothetical protein